MFNLRNIVLPQDHEKEQLMHNFELNSNLNLNMLNSYFQLERIKYLTMK
jgi:hypothetical protein